MSFIRIGQILETTYKRKLMHINAVITVPHKEGCNALRLVEKGDWDSPWFLDDGRFVQSNLLKKRGRPTSVYAIHGRCNSPDCPAEILIEQNEILRLLKDR